MNFNPAGATCLLGNKILNDNLLDCWRECLKLSDFSKQREEVDDFNKYVGNVLVIQLEKALQPPVISWASRKSANIKRGIAMGTTRMGMTHAGPYEQVICDSVPAFRKALPGTYH